MEASTTLPLRAIAMLFYKTCATVRPPWLLPMLRKILYETQTRRTAKEKWQLRLQIPKGRLSSQWVCLGEVPPSHTNEGSLTTLSCPRTLKCFYTSRENLGHMLPFLVCSFSFAHCIGVPLNPMGSSQGSFRNWPLPSHRACDFLRAPLPSHAFSIRAGCCVSVCPFAFASCPIRGLWRAVRECPWPNEGL